MLRFAICLLLVFPAACVAAEAAVTDASAGFVLPGDYSEQTSVADFVARFGKDNVRVVQSEEDGRIVRSLVLFPHDPARRAYVGFHDSAALQGVRMIAVRDRESRWRGKGGVRVGTTFAELRERNGKPFYLSGFDAQDDGVANDQWSPAPEGDDGSLGAMDVAEGEHMYFGVQLGLSAQAAPLPAGALPRDENVSSDDPRYPRMRELIEVTAINATTSLDDEWP